MVKQVHGGSTGVVCLHIHTHLELRTMKKCWLLVGLSVAACSPNPVETEPAPSVAPSVSRERRDDLKTVFGKAFARC